MVTEQMVYAFSQASWGSIFAGGAAAIAISVVMAILGVALGFTVVDPKSDDPTSGLGMAFGVWSFISVVISMAGGGFIAGLFAGQRGVEHGFLVWAIVIIAAMFFSSIAVGSAVRMMGAAVKSMGAGAAGVASSMGKGAMHAASGVIAELRDNVTINIDTDKLSGEVTSVLRDTGVETLQPEYLKQQMREARADLRSSIHQLTMNPSDSERIISDFLDKEKTRIDSLTRNIDRTAAVNALMHRRNIPQSEAESMVDDAIRAYDHVLEKGKESLVDAKAQVEDAKDYIRELTEDAREKADNMASTAAKAALAAAVALIVAAAISMGAGAYGARSSVSWYAIENTYIAR